MTKDKLLMLFIAIITSMPNIVKSACNNACLLCDNTNNLCIGCSTGYYLVSGGCIGCKISIPYCVGCTSNTVCTSCDFDYALNNNICISCSTAIENGLCASDCSNDICLNCSSQISQNNKITRVCNNYNTSKSLPYYIYIIIGIVVLIAGILIGFFCNKSRKKQKVISLHGQICSSCANSFIINQNHTTNCHGNLCLSCYKKSKTNSLNGNYDKCMFCKKFLICFIDFDKKCEKVFHYSNEEEDDKNKIINDNPSTNIRLQEDYKTDKSKSTDKCPICLGENPDAVIPCESKPLHKIHKYCLAELLNKNSVLCPLCKTRF